MPRSRPRLAIAAVRGAIQIRANRAALIRESTARLLQALLETNRLVPDQIVSAVFTATPDLNADFPAHAARRLGWRDVPLLGATEVGVPGALPRVVRVLLTVRDVPAAPALRPVYLDGAEALRPDLAHGAGARPPRAGAKWIALIGLGQIGGSIGLGLAASGRWRRVGFDRDPGALAAARDAGAIDDVAPSLAAACAGAALAVLAVPVDALPAVIADAAAALPRGAALLDTGSARRSVTEALARAARRGVHAIGGHPIAGTEGRGFASARADLFRDAPFAIFSAMRLLPRVVNELVRELGAVQLRVRPAPHDAALARTSHLPYLVACALASLGRGAARRGLAGPGFRGMTRLAAADPRVALAYCRANRAEIAGAWRALRRELDERVSALGR